MTEETTDSTKKFDLGSFSDKELEALVPMIETELAKRRESRKKEALEKMRAIAEDVGMTPEELLGLDRPRRQRQRATKRAPTGGWQHPDDPSKVYHSGRKPAWLKALTKEGREPIKLA
ncbi:putative Histone family protein nucleoid-structuring protein H-NS [Thiocapsa sp. KS1]|nr:H-NS histone family protein [Thiocapsa sp. KS1]CRI66949.1 putative Histone family protein nucleoid-structuring protein H-NS [Thiocapsa sp. KS1]